MAKVGKFIANNNLLGKELELFVGLDSEWLSYADGDAQSYTIIIATPTDYDEESGMLTLQNQKGQTFFISEGYIDMFWEVDSKFKLMENTSSTIKTGKKFRKSKDIM